MESVVVLSLWRLAYILPRPPTPCHCLSMCPMCTRRSPFVLQAGHHPEHNHFTQIIWSEAKSREKTNSNLCPFWGWVFAYSFCTVSRMLFTWNERLHCHFLRFFSLLFSFYFFLFFFIFLFLNCWNFGLNSRVVFQLDRYTEKILLKNRFTSRMLFVPFSEL